jgi:m7GpppX diphosphatase
MSKLTVLTDKTKFIFIPKAGWETSLTYTDSDITLKNDAYTTYNISAQMSGSLIVLGDLTKEKLFCRQTKAETYEEYEEIIKTRDPSKDQWIYNIITGAAEQENILYRNDEIIIIPDYSWNTMAITYMHMLTFPTNMTLKTIRSLRAEHIPLLKLMKYQTCQIIMEKYGLPEAELKLYFHYAPQTYHLHLHAVSVKNTEANSSVEYSHDIDSVIFNLTLCSDYYVLFDIKKRI